MILIGWLQDYAWPQHGVRALDLPERQVMAC
jgi:hypothetical protein